MNRRDTIRYLGLALGGVTLSPAVVRAVLEGFPAPGATDTLRTLTPQQGELLASLVEMIIPTTDTPGARDARVHVFIDSLLTDIFTPEERSRFTAGLEDLDKRAVAATGGVFLKSAADRQVALLQGLADEAQKAAVDAPRPFFPWLKELTLVGYYTSEIGASQELKYVHVAGYYDGDVPYEKVGRAYFGSP